MLPLHHPLLGVATSGREVDLSQPSLVDLVDDLHQRLATRGLLLGGEQVALLHSDGGEVGQLGAHLVAVIRLPVAEWAGANEKRHMTTAHPLALNLLGGSLHITGKHLVHGGDLGISCIFTAAAEVTQKWKSREYH